jgi:hypothetical protein
LVQVGLKQMTDCIVIPWMTIGIISLIMVIGGGHRLYYTINNRLDDTNLNLLLFVISVLCIIIGAVIFFTLVLPYIIMQIPCIRVV